MVDAWFSSILYTEFEPGNGVDSNLQQISSFLPIVLLQMKGRF